MQNVTQQIYTKNGIVKENIFPDKKILHIGSGNKKLPGSTSIDILSLPNVDIVHDLNEMPWPFDEGSFDLVYSHNSFEHLDDLIKVMEEVHRLLKPDGRVVITVPYFRSTDAFADPTHRHFFTSKSMEYFITSDSTTAAYGYTDKKFTKIGFWYGWPQPSSNPLVQMFKNFIHSHQSFYDSYLSLIFPAKIVVWELEKLESITNGL